MANRIRIYDSGGVLREFDPFFIAKRDITAAQINALNSEPQTLVPAPGAGKVLHFDSAIIAFDWGTVVFTKESASSLGIYYTDGSGQRVSETRSFTGFLDGESDIITIFPSINIASGGSGSAAANAPLVLAFGGGDPSGGDGVFHIRIHYRILETGL